MRNLMRGTLEWSMETTRYDTTGIAAVSLGRERPWAHLTTPGTPAAPRRS
jgi:pentalenene synthase